MRSEGDVLAGGKVGEAEDGDLVVTIDAVVVRLVSEGEGEDSLLLEVGLMDARKGAHNHSDATEEARLKGSVLARRALTKVDVTNDDPRDASLLVVAS